MGSYLEREEGLSTLLATRRTTVDAWVRLDPFDLNDSGVASPGKPREKPSAGPLAWAWPEVRRSPSDPKSASSMPCQSRKRLAVKEAYSFKATRP